MVVDALVTNSGGAAREAIRGLDELLAPAVLLAEALSAVRRMELRGAVSPEGASAAVGDLESLPIRTYPVDPFVDRIWALRRSITVYDAWYVALAEALDVPLLTADRRLSEAPGPRCEVRFLR